MSENLLFNELPRPTFSWLRVNHTEGQVWKNQNNTGAITVLSDEAIVKPLGAAPLHNKDFKGANSEALQELVKNGESYVVTVPANKKESITISIDGSSSVQGRFQFHVEEHGELEVLLTLTGTATEANTVQLLNEYIVGADATVTVKKVNLLDEQLQQIEHRYTELGDRAKVEYIDIELGGAENILSFDQNLSGEKCDLLHDLAYLGNKIQKFDISMIMTHGGKKSTSDIHVLGALGDTSKKFFRGTLDFLRGSIAAEGAEEDTCLLSTPHVKSISLPLLLCKEDNVVGNHAASAGQIDKTKLFYLMSRGFNEDEAKHMIVESMIRPIIDRIGNETIEETVLAVVRSKI